METADEKGGGGVGMIISQVCCYVFLVSHHNIRHDYIEMLQQERG